MNVKKQGSFGQVTAIGLTLFCQCDHLECNTTQLEVLWRTIIEQYLYSTDSNKFVCECSTNTEGCTPLIQFYPVGTLKTT